MPVHPPPEEPTARRSPEETPPARCGAFFGLIQQRPPFTLDADAWYFGRSAVVLLLLTALAAYGFRASVAGDGGCRRLPHRPA
jgi:hypothetical protein